MAVYERRYRLFEGELVAPAARRLVIPRYALREAFRSRVFASFYLLCFAPVLITLAIIVIAQNAKLLAVFGLTPGALAIDRFALQNFMNIQISLGYLVAIVVAPALLARDKEGGALPLLLARPIGRWEYLLGKLALPFGLLSLMTWVPGLLLYVANGAAVGDGWLLANVEIGVAMLIGPLVWIVVISLFGLAIAASVRTKTWARSSFLVLIFVAAGAGGAINGVFGTELGHLLNLPMLVSTIFADLFGAEPETTLPIWLAWLALATYAGLAALVVDRRVHAVEVVR